MVEASARDVEEGKRVEIAWIRLDSESYEERDALRVLAVMGGDASTDTTVGVVVVTGRLDGTADLDEYAWSSATETVQHYYGRTVDPKGLGTATLDLIEQADGIELETLVAAGQGAAGLSFVPYVGAEEGDF